MKRRNSPASKNLHQWMLLLPVAILGLFLALGLWSGRTEMVRENMESPRTPASAPLPSKTPQKDTLPLPSTAAPQMSQKLSGQGRWVASRTVETSLLAREYWQLEVSGLPVYPLRERVVNRSRVSGAVVSQSGESDRLAGPRLPRGSFRLDERDAMERSRAAWSQWGEVKGPRSAREIQKIIWAEDRSEGAQSQLAYRIVEQGRETIVDGMTGDILFRADRRVRN